MRSLEFSNKFIFNPQVNGGIMQSKCLIRVVVFWFSILLLDRFVFSSACGADTPSPSSQSLHFERDVRPILKAHCFQCHGEDGVVEADIDLRQVRLMRQSGAIDATDPSSSLLLEQIRTGTMPKGGKPLDSKSIETIEKWIEQGALTGKEEPSEVPSHFITDEERNHWSFRSIVAPSIPDVACDNPIDAFVSVMQGSKSLQFAEQADRITLLRRASLDLLGVPPSLEDLNRFLEDNHSDAWERAIDRMLKSSHYGERWGRHWLDVVGYADSNGGLKDSPRLNAWNYRDYVVNAMNEDKPWDTFIQEQLAGDELAGLIHERGQDVLSRKENWDRIAATGFLRMAPDYSGDSPADARVAKESVIVDNLKVIGSSFLGMTVGCAQCHDHRFDPISHVDYHRLRALIEPAFNVDDWRKPDDRQYEAYTQEERDANTAIEERALTVDNARKTLIRDEYHRYLEERLLAVDEALRESIRKAWLTEKDKRSKEEKELLEKHDFTFLYAEHLRFLPDRDAQETRREAMVHEAVSIREQKMSRVLMAADEKRDIIPKTLRFHRGDYRQPKEEVAPGDLSIFEGPEIPTKSLNLGSSGRRLAYARWLTSGEHPTVARVLVNRFWAQHFGKGLVESLADFGMRTSRPVQGDLLDWLASDFQQSGWRLKRFHKLVMTSKTYMQQSRNPAAESIDSENTYLARKQLRRLEAESVRDSILFVSGNLLSSLGGKPIGVARHPKGGVVLGKELSNPSNGVVHTVESWGDSANRRSLYVQNLRNRPLTVLQTFDMPVMTPNCNQRVTTTVAPQSLMMLNDSFVVEQSQVLASRLMAEQPDRIADQMKQLWLLAFGCEPTDFETAEGIAMVADEFPRQLEKGATASIASQRALAALCQIVLASNRFLYAP